MPNFIPTQEELDYIATMTNAELAHQLGSSAYTVSRKPDGAFLVFTNAAGERVVWIYVEDNVTGMHWSGWISDQMGSAESVAEIAEVVGL